MAEKAIIDFDENHYVRLRAVPKRKLNLVKKVLDAYQPNVTNIKLIELKLNSLDDIFTEYNEWQTCLEVNSQHAENFYDDRDEFVTNFDYIKTGLMDVIENYNLANGPIKEGSVDNSVASGRASPSLKLPAISLPKYDGAVGTWVYFHDSFVSLVLNNAELTNIHKWYYLKESLSGEAYDLLSSLTVSNDTFSIAWDLLCDRYNQPRVILSYHIKNILNLPQVKNGTSKEYRSLINELSCNIRAVESLLKDKEMPFHECLLIEILLDKLKQHDRKEWDMKLAKDNPSLNSLIKHIESKAQAIELHSFKETNFSKPKGQVSSKTAPRSFSVSTDRCLYCNKQNHVIVDCRRFKTLSLKKRKDFFKSNALCFYCAKKNHSFRQCSETCSTCNGKHHVLLHSDSHEPSDIASTDNHTDSLMSLKCKNISKVTSLLPTALVKVKDKSGKLVTARAILDTCSHQSFITANLLNKLRLPVSKCNLQVSGLNNSNAANVVKACNIQLVDQRDKSIIHVNCAVLQTITGSLPQTNIDISSWKLPHDIRLSDPNFNVPGKVDMLLGAEVVFNCIHGNPIKRAGYPTILETSFGAVIGGVIPPSCVKESRNPVCHFTKTDLIEQNLRRFWELEEIHQIPQTQEDKFCETHFTEHTTRDEDGRFVVRLPVRLKVDIGDTYNRAFKRMRILERRFVSNQTLQKEYCDFMNEYIALGHMELSPNKVEDGEFYIPHHAVFKPASTTTKTRVVFDGSAQSSNNFSLNDILCIGPTVQDDLFSIILRFRKYLVALTADITKMYRQIKVSPCDRKLQKILWRCSPTEPMQSYQLNTVTYGTSCASFLSTRCLLQLAQEGQGKFPMASESLRNSFYVDDFIGGCSNLDEAKMLIKQLTDLLKGGCFPIRKWCSNYPEVLQDLEPSLLARYFDEGPLGERIVQALGMTWNSSQDTFHFPHSIKPVTRFTKRNLLAAVSSLFDPLGLVAPIIIKCKILLQKIWSLKVSWDDILPTCIQEEWIAIYDSLIVLRDLNIERKLFLSTNVHRTEIHGFCDSSTVAYGACIYVKSIYDDNRVHVSLVTSKSRVAPIKHQTLPRLELCGALLLSRLLNKVLTALKLDNVDEVYLWSDAMIVLHWLNTSVSKLQVFVANRVSEIQENTVVQCWRHVPTNSNPADLLTRGILSSEIVSMSLWWTGPEFIHRNMINFPLFKPEGIQLPETRKDFDLVLLCNASACADINEFINRFSCIDKLKRVFAYVVRFCNNARFPNKRILSSLTVEEVENAFMKLVCLIQSREYLEEINCLKNGKDLHSSSKLKALSPFVDGNNILRVGGRLKNADLSYDTRHQIILPVRHNLSEILIRSEHNKLLHAGFQSVLASVRLKFWIPCCRNLIKRILRSCVICFKLKTAHSSQLMGQLPPNRVNKSFPFEHTGVDYCGPIQMKVGGTRSKTMSKAYIALFVCLATKAIHLELVTDLSTNSFLASLKRFISRRGLPRDIISDNGTNFVGAASELKRFFSDSNAVKDIEQFCLSKNFDWKFIPPRAPHFGGIWESMVRSMKSHLRKVIGLTVLTYEEYSTLLCQIESILNSRPLCQISDDVSCSTPLTPSHFLIGRPITSYYEPSLQHVPVNRLSRWQHIQYMYQCFWKSWSSDYLLGLQRKGRWWKKCPNIEIGQLVSVIEDGMPPLVWKMGRIVEVSRGSDGLVRVATIKVFPNKLIKRPIVKLAPLPIC